MKLTTEIGGHPEEIDIHQQGTRVVATFVNRVREVEVREIGDGLYLVFAGPRVYECRIEGNSPESVVIYTAGHHFPVNVSDPKRLRPVTKTEGTSHGASQVLAPMPGKVIRVLVEEGALVERGDGLLVVEAMKMQNEMKAPKTGKVIKITADPGTAVNAGDVLVIVE